MKLTQVSVLTGRLRHPPSGKLPVQMVIVVVASYFACISRYNDGPIVASTIPQMWELLR